MCIGDIVCKESAKCGGIGMDHGGEAPILRRENTSPDAILRGEYRRGE